MVEQAAELFPYSRTVRTQPAYFVLAATQPSDEGIFILRSVLRRDPFAADLTYGLGVHLFALGRFDEANAVFTAFMKLAPNSEITKRIKENLQ